MAPQRKSNGKRQAAAAEEQSIRLAKRPRLNEKVGNSSCPIPELPDDILRNIFKYLSTEDRVPLELVCKRFRSIDHEIGNRKFDEISVFHDYKNGVHIAAHLSTRRYEFHSFEKGSTNETIPLNFLKNSSAKCLSIFVGDNAKVDTLLEVHSLFKTFHFKELYLQFDSSSNVLDVLYRFRNIILSNVDVTIVWENLKDINIEDLRIALQSFPEMEKISLDIPDGHIENTISFFPHYVCDGKTMLHLINNSNNADLGSVDCTAQELFRAFEILCDSKRITKRATLLVLQATIDELFFIAEQRPELIVDEPGANDREFFDPIRGGILYVDDDWKDSISTRREICIYRDTILPR